MTKPSNKARAEMASRLGDLSDLPPELLTQLVSVNRLAPQHKVVLQAIGDAKEMDINGILIAIWRQHGEVWNRRHLFALIGRMKRLGLVETVSVGVYRAKRVAGAK